MRSFLRIILSYKKELATHILSSNRGFDEKKNVLYFGSMQFMLWFKAFGVIHRFSLKYDINMNEP